MILSAIDIGTNSVRCLITSFYEDNFKALYEAEKHCRPGEGVSQNGNILENNMFSTLNAVKEFHETSLQMGAEQILLIGTSACRDASNINDLITLIKKNIGLNLRVLSGQEEAEQIIAGISAAPERPVTSNHILVDVGAGSTEIIQIKGDEKYIKSLNLGALRLYEEFPDLGGKCSIQTIKEAGNFTRTLLEHGLDNKLKDIDFITLTASGGTATSAGMLIQKQINYIPEKVQGLKIGLLELETLISEIFQVTFAQRCKNWSLDKKKADILPAGLLILSEIMRFFEVHEMTISHFDILHGVITEFLKNKK